MASHVSGRGVCHRPAAVVRWCLGSYREVGAWPKEATAHDFLRVLEELADSADGEERAKLQRLSSAARDVGVGTQAGVLSAFIAGQR